jgi:phosphoribosylaminoimidazolecarboxamide formyltransferase/IMP cyclohydrolase
MGYPPHSLTSKVRLKRALLSCYDKTGLEELATTLSKTAGVELIASEGTAKYLKTIKLDVTPVEKITNFPEMPGGLVKTIHPKIHAMILAEINTRKELVDKTNPDQLKFLKIHEISPTDLVVCNLYPFKETVIKQSSIEACRSQIDIGGSALIRAAAKNYPRVAILTNPDQYEYFLKQIEKQDWCTTLEQRIQLAKQAFQATVEYECQIAKFMENANQNLDRSKQFYLIEKTK